MIRYDNHPSGRHFLQIPGPTNVPDRVLRAIDQPTIDHRGPEFAQLALRGSRAAGTGLQAPAPGCHLSRLRVPARGKRRSSTRLSPGDRVLMSETGHFALLWKTHRRAAWPRTSNSCRATGATAPTRLRSRRGSPTIAAHAIKAVCVVHNETSTGVTSRIRAVRHAIDAARHPALLMVDTISSLGVDRLSP